MHILSLSLCFFVEGSNLSAKSCELRTCRRLASVFSPDALFHKSHVEPIHCQRSQVEPIESAKLIPMDGNGRGMH